MRLWIGLHLPRLPLEVFNPRWCTDAGSVVLERERVLAASDAALGAGVRPGMRRGGVLMLLPDAQVHERAPAREAEARQAVALALLQYTPQVAEAEEATLLMDVGASLRLFGGIHALCARVRANVGALGFSASLACAPTARGAWLLARGCAGRPLRMASLVRRLDRLDVLLAPPARAHAAWFEGIGCATLGELRRLPRPGLQRRCGGALLDLLDAAYGLAPELHEWIAPPATFQARLELFDRIEDAELLLAGARRLLLQLTGWLCAHQLAVERVTLELEHERGRVARAPTCIEVALAEPAWRDEHLVRLLRERLAKLALDAPVIGLCLAADRVQPMAPPSESLFPEPGGTEQDRMRMLELLAARLGADNVLQPLPKADHRPENANVWVPVRALGQGSGGAGTAGATGGAAGGRLRERMQERAHGRAAEAGLPPDVMSLPRPTWLLAKPVALLMRDHRPFYGSPLRMASNPERIEAGWWDSPQTRDYFIAEGQDHTLYWVYRERIGAEDSEPRWFLHGLFG
ncbi:DNA polymerase Y family protein [Massilia forsythiae]|uniref:DNA polymerase Y family protein n=1 Tax=Massilia forsythiae TaxID=2728020 RepID=A0A7Z2VX08_9BURK|nr:DNA polymerase Y family protein [Massilia forsythiae]QJE01043.1 DNA polymerase Y family protein [Massilia forsythiae]